MCKNLEIASKELANLCKSKDLQTLLSALGDDSELYLVGGSIRDALTGLPTSDLDLACSLSPEKITEKLITAGIHTIPTGLQHQTVTAVISEATGNIEITTFRGSGMKPCGGVVQGKSIEEDLAFRDFTINSIAYNCKTFELIDPHQGLKDIEAKIIRCVGSAKERFAEDPLRVLRMIRFHSTLGFAIEENLIKDSSEFINAFKLISIERVRDEFSKTICGKNVTSALTLLHEIGILKTFLPELSTCVGFEQNRYHSKGVFEHTLEVVSKTRPQLTLRLSALFHDIGKPPSLSIGEDGERHFYKHERIGAEMTQEIMPRMKYSKKLTEQVRKLVDTHMRPITAKAAGLRRLLRDTEGVYPLWRELKEADATSVRLNQEMLSKQLIDFDESIQKILEQPDVSPLKNLAIKGNDLIELGLSPNPRFGEILRALHEKVLDEPELNRKDILIDLVKKEFLG